MFLVVLVSFAAVIFSLYVVLKSRRARGTLPVAESSDWANNFSRSPDRRLVLLVQLKCFHYRHLYQRSERDWFANAGDVAVWNRSRRPDLLHRKLEESITAWVGQGVVDNKQIRILTLWKMVLAVPDEIAPGQ
jgi:hypothetical protein